MLSQPFMSSDLRFRIEDSGALTVLDRHSCIDILGLSTLSGLLAKMACPSGFRLDGLLEPIITGGCETPKAKQENRDGSETLSTSTPSVASSVSTALPSPEVPGPASNFGIVKDGSIYRSSFPKLPNFEHLESLGLKTILTLVDTPYPLENQQFVADGKIMHVQLPLPAHKNAFSSIPVESMERALSILMDPRNHPVLVHCNKGKHRTGCVIGCYRKINDWTMADIVEEYKHYAGVKARDLDEKYIRLFDEDSMRTTIEYSLPAAFGQRKLKLSQSAPAATMAAFPNRATTV